jgi:hypothetical protein
MKKVYQHQEAFCLMKYQSGNGSITEFIWNSRDGVTPFSLSSKDGETTLNHVEWRADQRIPDFVPPIGTRYFASVTSEEIKERTEKRADMIIASNNGVLSPHFQNRQQLVDSLAAGYRVGEIPIVKIAK